DEFRAYPQVYFTASDTEFRGKTDLPPSSGLGGDRVLLTQLFGIGKEWIPWNEIVEAAANWTYEERESFSRWLEETRRVILGARDRKVIPAQPSLVRRGGLSFRFLLYQSRVQPDGTYLCEFLVMNEIDKPAGEPVALSRIKIFLASS